MIKIHRSLSWIIAFFDVRQWEWGDTSHGWRDKSADCRRAHVVGRVDVLNAITNGHAGASFQSLKQIKASGAVGLRELVARAS